MSGLAFRRDAFALLFGGERCHRCLRVATWDVLGQCWRCEPCGVQWVSGGARWVVDRVRSGRERMVE